MLITESVETLLIPISEALPSGEIWVTLPQRSTVRVTSGRCSATHCQAPEVSWVLWLSSACLESNA
jgi:hypothetical protein